MTIKAYIGCILALLLIGCTTAKPLADQTFTKESLEKQLDTIALVIGIPLLVIVVLGLAVAVSGGWWG